MSKLVSSEAANAALVACVRRAARRGRELRRQRTSQTVPIRQPLSIAQSVDGTGDQNHLHQVEL